MAQISVRQLANKLNADIQLLIAHLGVKSGSELIDENDPRIKTFGKTQAQPQSERTDSGAPVMFQEVGDRLIEKLEPVAQDYRLYAEQHLEERIVHWMNVPASEVRETRQREGKDNFDFFSVTQGHQGLKDLNQALAPSNSLSQKQLTTSTTPLTPPPSESPTAS